MSFISRATAISADDNVQQLYNDWATEYDRDMADESQQYVAPNLAAQAVLTSLGTKAISSDLEILDAGCGTGLVGAELAKLGARVIDGVDLSPGMLEVARKTGVYRTLETADLSKALSISDGKYDIVTCVGTLTQGHVGPEALAEFVRITKKGGIIVATVRENVWKAQGFDVELQRFVAEGKAELLGAELDEYRRGAAAKAHMVRVKVLT